MIGFLDVYYRESCAVAVCVVAQDWSDSVAFSSYRHECEVRDQYRPGQFYLRELKPLSQLIESVDDKIDVFVVDAYCQLDEQGTPGLGLHLANSLDRVTKVIGVAKNRLGQTSHAKEVFRGASRRPLFVTASGLPSDQAAELIRSMDGRFRIPTLLKLVDQMSRQ